MSVSSTHELGRWSANVLLDEAAATEMDEQSGTLTSGANPARRGSDKFRDAYGEFAGQEECIPVRGVDTGGASRFFPTFKYQAKAPTRERPRVDGVAHPTVKPLELMRWLVRLVTAKGAMVLEPFAGSGTTVQACIAEGMRCIAIEREKTYLPLIMHRIEGSAEDGSGAEGS
jgi:site-specific DNA-methyltransferase (adenine-specific)